MHAASKNYSQRVYVRLQRRDTRLFRYLLEAYDNLALTSVVDRKACILKVLFSPDQAAEARRALEDIRRSLAFEILDLN